MHQAYPINDFITDNVVEILEKMEKILRLKDMVYNDNIKGQIIAELKEARKHTDQILDELK